MNLILSFVHPTRPPHTLGPYGALRLDGEVLRDQDGATVALHVEHQWEVEGVKYFRLDCTARVIVHFERDERRSRWFGPYERFSAVDGLAYTDDRVFAFLDRKVGDWFCYDDGRHWPVMVVTDAAGSSRVRDVLASLVPMLPGVLALWQGATLLYLGTSHALRERLLAIAGGDAGLDTARVTGWTWEVSARPAQREAELLAEYKGGASSLTATYGAFHGNRVRATRLIENARALISRAQEIRATRRAAAAA